MEKPTRWQSMIKSLKCGFPSFNFIKCARIITEHGKEYHAENQEEFKEAIKKVNLQEPPEIIGGISFEFKSRKIKKEVRDFSVPLFEKFFPTKRK